MAARGLARQIVSKSPRRASTTARTRTESRTRRAARRVLGLSGERMAKVDTAWLRMDSPGNLMLIMGVWTLRPRVDYEALCERMKERLLKYPRFRQRVEEDAAGASWIDHQVDIHEHVVREELGDYRKGEKQAALQRRIGELATTPMDHSRPLWQMHLVEEYDGGSALIIRIHHCIGDGLALIRVIMSLMDGASPPPRYKHTHLPAGPEEWVAESVIRPLAEVAVKALGVAVGGASKGLELLREPHKGVTESVEAAHTVYGVVADAAALAFMPDDDKTALKGKPAHAKRVAWCPPLPLDEVKAVSKALDCSINDVLLSCAAGAIGEYLKSTGEDVAGKEIRAMIPVNLRPVEEAHKLGNRFGLVPMLLPIGIDHPMERLYEVRRRMTDLKGSTQPLLAFLILAAAGLMIKPAQDALLSLFSRKTTAVITNVPGPREKLKLLGSTLQESMFWVPQTGDIGVGISILSYGGGVQFGIITDIALCPQPQEIIDRFEPEFAKLSWVTLMLPWQDE